MSHGQAVGSLPKFLAIDFFCGAGGTTQGLIQAGGYVIAGVDKADDCRETFERNNVNRTLDLAPARFIQKDIFQRTDDYPQGQGEELLDELGGLLRHYRERYPQIPLLLSICAPCQPFTQMTRIDLSDERAWARVRDRGLLGQTFRFVERLRPAMILSENVAGIQLPKYGGVWQDFAERLKGCGYVVGSDVVDAAQFGIPQHRRRSIMLAVDRIDCRPEAVDEEGTASECLPVPTRDGTGRMVTVREALAGFPPIGAGQKHPQVKNHESSKLSAINLQRIRIVQPGESNIAFDEHGLGVPCHDRARGKEGAHPSYFSDIYTRMSPDRPSPTITTKCTSISNGRFGHYDMRQDRGISVREAAALQTFPDDYVFYGSGILSTSRMVGNAVPPKLAKFFADHLYGCLRAGAQSYVSPERPEGDPVPYAASAGARPERSAADGLSDAFDGPSLLPVSREASMPETASPTAIDTLVSGADADGRASVDRDFFVELGEDDVSFFLTEADLETDRALGSAVEAAARLADPT